MVEIGRKVKILYTAMDEDGTIFDSSDKHGGAPLEFVIGSRQVIVGLEKAVRDMIAYEKRTVTIQAREAYGEYDPGLIEQVPVEDFPNAEKLPVGGYITFSLPGEQMKAKVVSIEDGMITFDHNHELAGHDLTFDIELIEIYGETGSAIENEQHANDCGCGCQILKQQLTPASK